jgi:hypothetical protein
MLRCHSRRHRSTGGEHQPIHAQSAVDGRLVNGCHLGSAEDFSRQFRRRSGVNGHGLVALLLAVTMRSAFFNTLIGLR